MRRKLQKSFSNAGSFVGCKMRQSFSGIACQNIYKRAFSLIELSIVLVIISIIIAGTLSVSTVAINNAKIKITNERIQEVYKALGNYLLTNKRLPFPAALQYVSKNSAGYATEVTDLTFGIYNGVYIANNSQDMVFGMVPANALGLSNDMAEDAFGSKLMYIVNKKLTTADFPNLSGTGFSFGSIATNQTIKILNNGNSNVVDNNVLLIMSYGPNKFGAFNASSTSQNSTTSSDSYEAKNYFQSAGPDSSTSFWEGNIGNVYDDSRITITVANPSSDGFDDIILFKTKNEIITDFNAMFLVPCDAVSNDGHVYPTAYYGSLSYSNTACNTPNTTIPSQRCGPFGAWSRVDGCSVW